MVLDKDKHNWKEALMKEEEVVEVLTVMEMEMVVVVVVVVVKELLNAPSQDLPSEWSFPAALNPLLGTPEHCLESSRAEGESLVLVSFGASFFLGFFYVNFHT